MDAVKNSAAAMMLGWMLSCGCAVESAPELRSAPEDGWLCALYAHRASIDGVATTDVLRAEIPAAEASALAGVRPEHRSFSSRDLRRGSDDARAFEMRIHGIGYWTPPEASFLVSGVSSPAADGESDHVAPFVGMVILRADEQDSHDRSFQVRIVDAGGQIWYVNEESGFELADAPESVIYLRQLPRPCVEDPGFQEALRRFFDVSRP